MDEGFFKAGDARRPGAFHEHLASEFPLCLLVYSGSESLHGWYATVAQGADARGSLSRSRYPALERLAIHPDAVGASRERRTQRVVFFDPDKSRPFMKTTGKNDRARNSRKRPTSKRKFAHEEPEEPEARQDFADEEKAKRELRRVQSKNLEELETDFPPLLLPGYLYEGRRAMVSGKPISGKGILIGQASCCVATAEPWLGVTPAGGPKKVLHLDFELMEPQLRQRIYGFARVYANGVPKKEKELRALLKENLKVVSLYQKRHLLFSQAAWEDFARRVDSHEAVLVSLDPSWRLMLSERDERLVNEFLSRLDQLERRTGVSTIYAQHQTKGAQESRDVVDRFSGLSHLARDAATIITMLDKNDLGGGCFLIEARTNDFAQPEDFHIIREYPVFRRLSEEEFRRIQGDRPGKRDSSPVDLLRLIPPFAADLGKGPKDILRETLIAKAKVNEPSIGKNKCEDYLKILKEQKQIDWVERKDDPRERGRGSRYFFRTEPGI